MVDDGDSARIFSEGINPYDYLFEYILFKYGDGQYVHSAKDIDEFSGASGKKENRTPNPKLFFQFIFFFKSFPK